MRKIKGFVLAGIAIGRFNRAMKMMNKAEKSLRRTCSAATRYYDATGADEEFVGDVVYSLAVLQEINETLRRHLGPSNMFEVLEKIKESEKKEKWLENKLREI